MKYVILGSSDQAGSTCLQVGVTSAADAVAARRSGRGSPSVAFSGPLLLASLAEPVDTTLIERKLTVGDVGGNDSRCRSPAVQVTLRLVVVLVIARSRVDKGTRTNRRWVMRFICCRVSEVPLGVRNHSRRLSCPYVRGPKHRKLLCEGANSAHRDTIKHGSKRASRGEMRYRSTEPFSRPPYAHELSAH